MEYITLLACALVFILTFTAFNIIGYFRGILLMNLFAFIGLLVGLPWSFDVLRDAWLLPAGIYLCNLGLVLKSFFRHW